MSEPAVVFDSGVIDQAATSREFRWVLRELLENGWTPLIPTVVLSEAITGRPEDAPANQVIRRLETVDTSQATARRAGHLRFSVQRTGIRPMPSGIDAIVAAHAVDVGRAVVFTTNTTDLRRLLVDHPQLAVEKP
jgi:predicted nucleic acid-binding protein